MLEILSLLAAYPIDVTPLPDVTADQPKFQLILQVVFSIIGALSLVFVTLGGLRYIGSQGDPKMITQAKNTVLYALVGLVVSIVSVAIVTFVMGVL